MQTNATDTIQGPVLAMGDAVSPYTVQKTDKVVEFTSAGIVDTDGRATTVLVGSRYAIGSGVKVITFSGTFNVS